MLKKRNDILKDTNLHCVREIGQRIHRLRWLNRVMQDHEARASDLNRKLIFSFFFAIFLIKATET